MRSYFFSLRRARFRNVVRRSGNRGREIATVSLVGGTHIGAGSLLGNLATSVKMKRVSQMLKDTDSCFNSAWLNPGQPLRCPEATSPLPPARIHISSDLPPALQTTAPQPRPTWGSVPPASTVVVPAPPLLPPPEVEWLWRTLPYLFFSDPVKGGNTLRNLRD